MNHNFPERGPAVGWSHQTPRLLQVFRAALLLALVNVLVVAHAQDVSYTAVKDTSGSKATAAAQCQQLGGSLVADTTDAVHTAAVAAIRSIYPSGTYVAFLGGSTSRSIGCPVPSRKTASTNCVWYWESAPYDVTPMAFYRGNFRPYSSVYTDGLVGAGSMNDQTLRFGKQNDAQLYPANEYGQHLVLLSVENVFNDGVWADNNNAGGFVYFSQEQDKGARLFYDLCRVVATTSTSTATPGSDSSAGSLGSLSDNSLGSSSTSSSSSGGSRSPSGSSSDASTNDRDVGSTGGLSVGAWVGIGIAIGVVIIIVVVLCCCRQRIAACCCGAKEESESEASEPDADDRNSNRSFSVPTGSFRSVAPSEISNASARRMRKSLAGEGIPVVTPDDVVSQQRNESGTYTDTYDGLSVNGYVQPVRSQEPPPSATTYTSQAVDRRRARASSFSRQSSNLSDDSKSTFRQSRTVSFFE